MDRSENRTLLTGLKQVYTDNENNFSDIKLRSKDNMLISAHKVILAARSPYLKSLLEKECSKPDFSGTLEISSIDAKPLVSILHWMYSDELLPDAARFMDEVVAGATTFQLAGLIELVDKTMIDLCKPTNMFELFRVAEKYQMNLALEQLADYIKANIDDLLPFRVRDSMKNGSVAIPGSAKTPGVSQETPNTSIKNAEESLVKKIFRYFIVVLIAWFIFAIFTNPKRR